MQKTFNTMRYSSPTWLILLLWALTMSSVPILGWILGEDYLQKGISVGVVMQVAAVLVILYQSWGARRSASILGMIVILTYCAELLGSSTGIPFGKYHYTAILQPQIRGVPLLIPLAWMMMLPPAWAIANLITGKSGSNWSFVVVSALAFTAWDLFLDPQMVSWGFWRWEIPGQYFGIPISNFAGWIIISLILTFIASPRDLPAGPLALIYVFTWLLQTTGQGIFWSQPGPAAVGFLGTGFFIVLAHIKSKNRTDRNRDFNPGIE